MLQLHGDGSFVIFSTNIQYLGWVWIITMHFSTYPIWAKWHIVVPGEGSEKNAYLVAKERTYWNLINFLICYCIDYTCKISGSMALVNILDTEFQYPPFSKYQYCFGQLWPPSQNLYHNWSFSTLECTLERKYWNLLFQ